MPGIKTKYDQTKVCDTPLYKEYANAQEIFSVVSIDDSGIFAVLLENDRPDFQTVQDFVPDAESPVALAIAAVPQGTPIRGLPF